MSKKFRVFNKITLIIEESIQVTFDETNPKELKLEVIGCASILEKTNQEENDQEAKHGQSLNQVIYEEPGQDQSIDTHSDHQDHPKEWRIIKYHHI